MLGLEPFLERTKALVPCTRQSSHQKERSKRRESIL